MKPTTETQMHCAMQLLDLLPWLRHYLGTAVRQEGSISLSLLELRILSRLNRFSGISLSSLAEELGINKATTSTAIERMVRQSLVSREKNPQSRREVVLTPTPGGLSHLSKSHGVLQAKLLALMDSLSASELSSLEAGLFSLRKMLQTPYPQLAHDTDTGDEPCLECPK